MRRKSFKMVATSCGQFCTHACSIETQLTITAAATTTTTTTTTAATTTVTTTTATTTITNSEGNGTYVGDAL